MYVNSNCKMYLHSKNLFGMNKVYICIICQSEWLLDCPWVLSKLSVYIFGENIDKTLTKCRVL